MNQNAHCCKTMVKIQVHQSCFFYLKPVTGKKKRLLQYFISEHTALTFISLSKLRFVQCSEYDVQRSQS